MEPEPPEPEFPDDDELLPPLDEPPPELPPDDAPLPPPLDGLLPTDDGGFDDGLETFDGLLELGVDGVLEDGLLNS